MRAVRHYGLTVIFNKYSRKPKLEQMVSMSCTQAVSGVYLTMQITKDNLESFITSLHKRLANELRHGAPIELHMQVHYPEEMFIEVGGETYPTFAIGETVSLKIGACPKIKP